MNDQIYPSPLENWLSTDETVCVIHDTQSLPVIRSCFQGFNQSYWFEFTGFLCHINMINTHPWRTCPKVRILFLKVEAEMGRHNRDWIAGSWIELDMNSCLLNVFSMNSLICYLATFSSQLCQQYICMYCRTGFDSAGLTAAKIAAKNDRYRWNLL